MDTGLNDLLRQIDIYKNTVVTAVASGIAQVSVEVAEHAKVNHSFTNRTHNLENSIQPLPVKIIDGEIIGGVNAGKEYAVWVECGTFKNAPYPFLAPSIEANRSNFNETIASVTERADQIIKVK